MKWFAVSLLLLGTSHQKHLPENPRDVIRYGCIVQARQNDPNWHVYVWAQTGEGVNCSDELVHNQTTGKAISGSCYVYQLAMTARRKEGLNYCSQWMDDLKGEIVRLEKKH